MKEIGLFVSFHRKFKGLKETKEERVFEVFILRSKMLVVLKTPRSPIFFGHCT